MRGAIEVMKKAFIQLSNGQAVVPLRTRLDMPTRKGAALFMPVFLEGEACFGVKTVSLFKDNPAQGLPLIHAIVTVFEAQNGKPIALLNGEKLTALRTGAASGLATDLLANHDANIVAIFGAGVQGRAQLEAICSVRQIQQAYIFDLDPVKADTFAREMSSSLHLPVTIPTSLELLRQADIICTATTSSVPVFEHVYLKPGVHINAVGSYRPGEREIPSETVAQAKVIVDQRTACLTEAGDLVIPIQQGLISSSHIYAEIGEIASGKLPGRTSQGEFTLFKSVGNAVQDLAAAHQIIHNAEKLGLGNLIEL